MCIRDRAHTVVADSGYGSEENYRFMSENGMEAYVKSVSYTHLDVYKRQMLLCQFLQSFQRVGNDQ